MSVFNKSLNEFYAEDKQLEGNFFFYIIYAAANNTYILFRKAGIFNPYTPRRVILTRSKV